MSSILKEFVSAGIPIIWVYSIEEDRFIREEATFLLHKRLSNRIYVYDANNIIYDYERDTGVEPLQIMDELDGPVDAIQRFCASNITSLTYEDTIVDGTSAWNILEHGFPNRSTLILLDAPFYMTDPNKVKHTNARLTRCIKDSVKQLNAQQKHLVFVNHHTEVPIELDHYVTYAEHRLPNVSKMKSIVRSNQVSVSINGVPDIILSEDELIKTAQSLTGLTQWQAENVLALSNRENALEYISNKTDRRTFKSEVIRKEKSRLFSKSGVLKIVETNWGMEEVGGMENLKAWAKDRTLIFSHEAREDGIDLPKGLCVVGPGGTGKSWVAQALGKEWDRTVLRLDIGACMGSLLGESESKLIKALADAEAQSPCILFVDEFEKLFAGAGGNVTDGGTFQRMYGTWLTWSQSKKADVFVVATTNSITNIPAPALRKGRFDEVIYVGLPGLSQRKEIFSIHLKKRGWDPDEYKIDLKKLAEITPNRTGSEIEQIVIEGLIRKGKDVGFGKSFPIETKHLVDAVNDVKIMAELNPDESRSLLEWARSHKVMMANKDDEDLLPTSKSSLKIGVLGGVNKNTQEHRRIELNEDDL
jgi:SpoVK/Ycf46/Vps4 family AAA+-type ATPase